METTRQQEATMQNFADGTAETNPVVRETRLNAYPGWIVRQYANGMFDATNGIGLTPGFRSFHDTVAFLRSGAW